MIKRNICLMVPLYCLMLGLIFAQQSGEISYRDDPALPEGKIGQQIQRVIDTFNSGDPETIRKFFKEVVSEEFLNIAPMERHIDVFLRFFRETGGLDYHSIRHYTPERSGETIVILKDRVYEIWRAILLKFTPEPASLISQLQFSDARTPSNVKEPELTEDQLLKELESFIARLSRADIFLAHFCWPKENGFC